MSFDTVLRVSLTLASVLFHAGVDGGPRGVAHPGRFPSTSAVERRRDVTLCAFDGSNSGSHSDRSSFFSDSSCSAALLTPICLRSCFESSTLGLSDELLVRRVAVVVRGHSAAPRPRHPTDPARRSGRDRGAEAERRRGGEIKLFPHPLPHSTKKHSFS